LNNLTEQAIKVLLFAYALGSTACAIKNPVEHQDAGVTEMTIQDAGLATDAGVRTDSGVVPPQEWGIVLGATGGDQAKALVTDEIGNVYIIGDFTQDTNLGDKLIRSEGQEDVYIASYTATGSFRWARTFGGYGRDYANHLEVDSKGNVYLVGSFNGNFPLWEDVNPSKGSTDIFIISLSSDGDLNWYRTYGGSGEDTAFSITIDSKDHLYVCGVFGSVIEFGSETLESVGVTDIFVLSLTAEGEPLWAKRYGGESGERATFIKADGQGRLYVAGFFIGSMPVGDTRLTSVGGTDIFIIGLTTESDFMWALSEGEEFLEYVKSMAIDDAGNIYVGGGWAEPKDDRPCLRYSNSNLNSFVSSFDPKGLSRWKKTWRSHCQDEVTSVKFDKQGRLYVAGHFSEELDYEGESLSSNSQLDLLFARFTKEGVLEDVSHFGTQGQAFARGMDFDNHGNMLVTGSFYGTLGVAGQQLKSIGDDDIFLVSLKLAP